MNAEPGETRGRPGFPAPSLILTACALALTLALQAPLLSVGLVLLAIGILFLPHPRAALRYWFFAVLFGLGSLLGYWAGTLKEVVVDMVQEGRQGVVQTPYLQSVRRVSLRPLLGAGRQPFDLHRTSEEEYVPTGSVRFRGDAAPGFYRLVAEALELPAPSWVLISPFGRVCKRTVRLHHELGMLELRIVCQGTLTVFPAASGLPSHKVPTPSSGTLRTESGDYLLSLVDEHGCVAYVEQIHIGLTTEPLVIPLEPPTHVLAVQILDDYSGVPVPYAGIELRDSTGFTLKVDTADFRGMAELCGTRGEFRLLAHKDGFDSTIVTIAIPAGDQQNIRLPPHFFDLVYRIDPTNALVLVDRKQRPESLPAGTYPLAATFPEYVSFYDTITIPDDTVISVSMRKIRPPLRARPERIQIPTEGLDSRRTDVRAIVHFSTGAPCDCSSITAWLHYRIPGYSIEDSIRMWLDSSRGSMCAYLSRIPKYWITRHEVELRIVVTGLFGEPIIQAHKTLMHYACMEEPFADLLRNVESDWKTFMADSPLDRWARTEQAGALRDKYVGIVKQLPHDPDFAYDFLALTFRAGRPKREIILALRQFDEVLKHSPIGYEALDKKEIMYVKRIRGWLK